MTIVGIAKNSGSLLCLHPLYQIEEKNLSELECIGVYQIVLLRQPIKPVAYLVEYGVDSCPLVKTEIIDKYVEILGEL